MPARVRDLSHLINAQTGSAANPASYSVGKGGSFTMGEVAGSEADHLPQSGSEAAHIHAFMVCIWTSVPLFLMLLVGSH